MQNKSSGRGGFTLIEVLVTLILLAVLAAAVFPVVTQQAEQGDPVKAAQDLGSIRSGIEQFQLNVRPSFPGDLEDLVYRISDLTGNIDNTVAGGVYSSTQLTKWDGPYVDLALAEDDLATGIAFETGFGGIVENELTCFNASSVLISAKVDESCVSGRDFVAVEISGLSDEQFESLNGLIDGENETNPEDTGKLRFLDDATVPSPNVDQLDPGEEVYYLAVPFRGN